MTDERRTVGNDRRRVPRGGRRTSDLPGYHPRVLIIDSDDGARRPCARYLTHFHFQVDEAATLPAALVALSAGRPHIAITEEAVRGGSGLPAKLANEFHVPVIVTTTDGLREGPPEAAAVLVKPFQLSAMLEQIRQVLRLTAEASPGVIDQQRQP